MDRKPPAVEPIDAHATDAAAEQSRFDQDTARRAGLMRSVQETRLLQIRRQFIKSMPGWLHPNSLEHSENTTVKDLCLFAPKQLSIHYLFKT